MKLIILSKIFLIGILILLSAIVINFLAKKIGLLTWYEFIEKISEKGFFQSIKELNFALAFFIFIIYPFLLGLAGYYFTNIFF